jgi:predicted porin
VKKHFIAVACLGAIAAHGQSSITLYGSADIALSYTSPDRGTTLPSGGSQTAKTSKTSLDSGVGPGSRIGFRGREDLGGGLGGVFLAEMGMAYDTGALQQGGLGFGRQIFVGLVGSDWSLTAGRQYSPLDVAFGSSDPMYGFYWGNVMSISGHSIYESLGAAPGDGAFQSAFRVDNSVQGTLTFNKLTAKLMWGAGNEDALHNGRLWNASIGYVDGPWNLNASYLQMRTPSSMLRPKVQGEELSIWVVGGQYDFGFARVGGGVYEYRGPEDRTKLAAIAFPGATGASPFAYSWESNLVYWLGASVPIGAGRLSFDITRLNYDYATGPDGKSWGYGAVYEYFLSKRSSLYISAGKINNDSRSRTPLIATITTIVPNGFGSNPSAVSLGMQHKF